MCKTSSSWSKNTFYFEGPSDKCFQNTKLDNGVMSCGVFIVTNNSFCVNAEKRHLILCAWIWNTSAKVRTGARKDALLISQSNPNLLEHWTGTHSKCWLILTCAWIQTSCFQCKIRWKTWYKPIRVRLGYTASSFSVTCSKTLGKILCHGLSH